MKKIRIFVYITQLLLTIILLVILTVLTPNAGLDPLYLPLGMYLLIIALMLVIFVAQGFFFKLFGIKWAKSDSEKFLMAKDYTKKAIIVIIVAVIIMAITNILAPITDENIDSSETVFVANEYNTTFWSQDAFAISGIKSITLTSDDSILLDVYILLEDDYLNNNYGKRINIANNKSKDITYLSYKRESYMPYGEYVLYIDAKGGSGNVTYSFERTISQSVVWELTIFPIIFVGINAAWIVYLWPLRKKYEKSSIYE